jgi:Family of unknown function (DUF5757)
MIKAVVYRRANIIFSIGSNFLDGNLIFDDIKLSDTLKAAIRFNYGSLWYKFCSSEKFDKKNRELDKIVISFIEKKVSKSFQGMSLDVILSNSKYSMILRDGVILVVSQFSNKRRVNIVLDFFKDVYSLDYCWSCRDQEFDVKNIVTSIISSSLNKYISFDEKILVKDITIDIEFDGKFPRLDVLSDIVTNDDVLGKSLGFSLCERHMPRSLKSKYILYMDVESYDEFHKVYGQQIVLVFIKRENLVVRINELQDRLLIPEIKRRLCLLMKGYREKEKEIAFIYDKLLGCFLDDTSYSGEKLVEIKNLRREVPELFIAGYSRECSVKPFIVSEEKANELERDGRKTIRYPKDGFYSRIYACPVGYYPGLKKNRLLNRKMFKYLPACYITDHSLNPDSNYSRYYFGDFQREISGVDKEVRMVESELYDGYGTVPEMLKRVIMCGSSDRELLKIGVPKTKSSCLYCIYDYMGKKESELDIVNIRKRLTFNPCICLQELWYMDLDEILSTARNPDCFLDPTLYVRALESIYCLNIYVFNVTKKYNVELSIAECPLPYIWEPVQGGSIVIFCYRDVFDFPYCEYIKIDDVQSMRLRDYKKEYLALIKGPELVKPFVLTGKYYDQRINESGKCIGVVKDGIMEPCFWRPLDVRLDESSEGYLNIRKDIQNREMAYFLCDIISILKNLCQNECGVIDYFEVIQEDVLFEPFVIREKFESEHDFFSYYSARLPSIFKGLKIVVSEKVYSQLLKFLYSFSYSRLFSKVIKFKHFTKLDNTIIVIRKR